MYAGAALELATLITILATAGSVKSAVLGSHPAAWHLALIHLTIDEIAAPIVMVLGPGWPGRTAGVRLGPVRLHGAFRPHHLEPDRRAGRSCRGVRQR